MLDAETPIEAARWLDEAIVGEHGRTYEEVASLASHETGYLVYRADGDGSDLVTVVENGQDPYIIEAVIEACPLVATIRVTTAD